MSVLGEVANVGLTALGGPAGAAAGVALGLGGGGVGATHFPDAEAEREWNHAAEELARMLGVIPPE